MLTSFGCCNATQTQAAPQLQHPLAPHEVRLLGESRSQHERRGPHTTPVGVVYPCTTQLLIFQRA